MRAGASDYLTKPYLQEELVERVSFLLDLPPFARSTGRQGPAVGAGSNRTTARPHAGLHVLSALSALEVVRPRAGSLPAFAKGTGVDKGKDGRPIPLDEKSADALYGLLIEVRALIEAGDPDADELAGRRADLLAASVSLTGWLGARGTVLTDEILKRFVPIGAAVFIAHLVGLRFDIMHVLAALAALSSIPH